VKRAVGYVRVSSSGQAENGGGLEIQRQAIASFAKRKRWEVAGVVEDAGVSGALEDRPGLVEIEHLLREGAAEVVVVHRLDRLARDLLVQESLIADWQRLGAQVVSVEEPDLCEGSADRKLLRQVLGALAEFNKARLKAQLKWGREQAAKKGRHPGGGAPLGYNLEGKLLVVNPEEAATVKRAAALRRRGMGWQRIAKTLDAEGRATKRGGAWAPNTVRKMLHGAAAKGMIRFAGQEYRGQQDAILKSRSKAAWKSEQA
jgi:DNA invertase Pin-like site-specific DNA recombinase